MKFIILFSMLFLLSFNFVESATQITTFGKPYGIVADNNEWSCSVNQNNSKSLLPMSNNSYIKGSSKSVPMFFEFFQGTQNFYGTPANVKAQMERFLSHYAIETSSIISNVSAKGDESHYIVMASFFDNKSSGYIMIHIKEHYYIMFVELRTDLFDEATRINIMSKPYDLITPLYQPYNLSVPLEVDLENCSGNIILKD